MTKNLDTTADATGATACECSKYEANIPEQLTEENLASGDYDTFSTGCTATTKREFAPGHDAKLKSFLIEHGAQGHGIVYGITHGTAEDFAKQYTFGYMIVDGIEKAKGKLAAKAEREAARVAKKAAKGKSAERKLAESAGVVKTQPLADVVKAEEDAHQEAEARKVAEREQSADWDDEPKVAPILEDEAAMNTSAREAREAGLVKAKVGRWVREGYLNDDESFTYAKKLGGTETVAKGKYTLEG